MIIFHYLEENLNNYIKNGEFNFKKEHGFDKSRLWDINSDVTRFDFSISPLDKVDERWEILAKKICDHYFKILST